MTDSPASGFPPPGSSPPGSSPQDAPPDFLERPGRPRLAWRRTPGTAAGAGLPEVLFLGGYRSDMNGTKALFLEEQCRARGQAFTRFDYSGHGLSGGVFAEQTLSLWKDDALAIVDRVTGGGKLVLAGSSMGGWLALLVARERAARVAGIVGIAAAPDFTRNFAPELLTPAQRAELAHVGRLTLPSAYGEPYIFTRALIEDGEAHCLLDAQTPCPMPVRLVQGMKDRDVPWQTAHRLKNAIDGDVMVFLVEQGEHCLSAPAELALIDEQVRALSGLP